MNRHAFAIVFNKSSTQLQLIINNKIAIKLNSYFFLLLQTKVKMQGSWSIFDCMRLSERAIEMRMHTHAVHSKRILQSSNVRFSLNEWMWMSYGLCNLSVRLFAFFVCIFECKIEWNQIGHKMQVFVFNMRKITAKSFYKIQYQQNNTAKKGREKFTTTTAPPVDVKVFAHLLLVVHCVCVFNSILCPQNICLIV